MERATVTERSPKVVRSYRLVFHRRWRIFHIQNWRIPLPGGLELRAVGYWLICLAGVALLGSLPLLGLLIGALPTSIRLGALPLFGAWLLSGWEVDGRAPHRALLGIAIWAARPRVLAGLRRCAEEDTEAPALGAVAMAPDLRAARYPRGRLRGPARILLRYPVSVRAEGFGAGAQLADEEKIARARRWRLRATGGGPLHRGYTLEVPAGRVVIFE